MIQKKWLYTFVLFCSVGGGAWVWWNAYANIAAIPNVPDVCLFRRVTGLPCPSCGTTHSVVHIMKLDFKDALYDNPLGYIIALGIIIFPFWVCYDLVARKNSFYRFYTTIESVVTTRRVAVPLILLLVANWAWNIYKYNL